LSLLGAQVTLTDVESVLPLLHKNALKNSCKVDIKSIDWCGEFQINEIFDFIIASDVVYKQDLVIPFINTVEKLCTPKTVFYLCQVIRDSFVHSLFLEEMKKRGFDCKRVPTEKQHPDVRDKDCVIYIFKKVE
jgi:predicted nicotinamide N-methyase